MSEANEKPLKVPWCPVCGYTGPCKACQDRDRRISKLRAALAASQAENERLGERYEVAADTRNHFQNLYDEYFKRASAAEAALAASEAEVGRLRKLVAHAAPMAWVSDHDMDGACEWEREASVLVYPRRAILDGSGTGK